MLKPEVWEKIFDLFTDAFLKIKKRDNLNDFFDNFFSPTEKIMFSKRFAIAVLLAKGNDYESIKNTLRVTDGTIAKVNLKLNKSNSGLQKVVEEILKRDAGKVFWKEMASIIDYPGKGRSRSRVGKREYKRDIEIDELRKGLG